MDATGEAIELVFLILAAVLLVILTAGWWRTSATARETRDRLQRLEAETGAAWQRLQAGLGLGARLLEACDEEAAIQAAMSASTNVLNAIGSVFVPFDEWKQSLTVIRYGKTPSSTSEDWTLRLFSPATRQTCKICQARQSGKECILLRETEGAENVFCVALRRGSREIGVLSFFFERPPLVDEQTHVFLAEMAHSVELALDLLHTRRLEREALRLIEQSPAARRSLSPTLKQLLADVRKATGADYAALWVPGDGTFLPPILHLEGRAGEVDPWLDEDFISGAWRSLAASGKTVSLKKAVLGAASGQARLTIVAIPILWQDLPPLGMLLLGAWTPGEFTQRSTAWLNTVAANAALLIQSEREMARLEYRAIAEERARLAREIHDGLAQTLAFLKMETARIQSYLSHGNIEMAAPALNACYRTLSDAYLDARQAIEDLRSAPETDLGAWLQRTAEDFSTLSGIEVEIAADTLHTVLPMSVQVQLTRIVQEALTNVRKHAEARRVVLSAFEKDGALVVEVQDDGKGFLPPEDALGAQYGLRGMRERAETIGAEFQVVSAPGMGTRVRVSVALPQGVFL